MNQDVWKQLFQGLERIAQACKEAGQDKIADEIELMSKSIGQLPQPTPRLPEWGSQLGSSVHQLQQQVEQLKAQVAALEQK